MQTVRRSSLFTHSLRYLMPLWMMLCMTVTTSAYAQKPQTLLVVGDSLSAAYGIPFDSGWVQLLGVDYAKQNWNVVNASITGDTTGGGLARLPALLAEHSPTIVMIELGANDGLRGYPLKTIETNLQKMIEMAQAKNAQVVLIGMLIPPNYGKRYTEGFAANYVSLAQRYNTALIPFLLDNVAIKKELMQADGLHPTQQAQPIILKTVLNVVAPLMNKTAKTKNEIKKSL
jgi:acyl-CoA thioesterase-1